MKRAVVVRRSLDATLNLRVDEVIRQLRTRGSYDLLDANSLVGAPEADVYLLCGDQLASLTAELTSVASTSPARLPRTLIVGAPFDFTHGSHRTPKDTVVELMELHRLGGWLSPDALTSWNEAIALFAGPQELMEEMQTNAYKAFQSDNYAVWFASRRESIEDFLAHYLPVLEAWATKQTAR